MIEVVKEIIILYTIVHPLSGCPVWERQHKYNTMNSIQITTLIVYVLEWLYNMKNNTIVTQLYAVMTKNHTFFQLSCPIKHWNIAII